MRTLFVAGAAFIAPALAAALAPKEIQASVLEPGALLLLEPMPSVMTS